MYIDNSLARKPKLEEGQSPFLQPRAKIDMEMNLRFILMNDRFKGQEETGEKTEINVSYRDRN